MKKILRITLLFAVVAGSSGVCHAVGDTGKIDDILSAIDVVNLMEAGSSDADIARLMIRQRGFDMNAAPVRGKTDGQVINYLLANSKKEGSVNDKTGSMKHYYQGDNYSKKADFGNSAKEYSIAVSYSDDNPGLFMKRADTYKKYLAAKLPHSTENQSDESKRLIAARSRIVMCAGIHSDLMKAQQITNGNILQNDAALNAIKFRMNDPNMTAAGNRDVLPYYQKSAEKSQSMRQLHNLYQTKRALSQSSVEIAKSIDDYKVVCSVEEASRRKTIMAEMDRERNRKWLPVGELDGTRYFYDKSSVVKSKESQTIWIRLENYDLDKSYDTVKVNLNCKKGIIGTAEIISYDDQGRKIRKGGAYGSSSDRKIVPGTADELLFKEMCRKR